MNDYKMQFTEDLINTYDEFLDQPEHLRTPEDLAAFLQRHGLQVASVSAGDLEAVKQLRERLRPLWSCGDLNAVTAALNDLTRDIPAQIAYTLNGTALELSLAALPDSPLADNVALAAAEGLFYAIAAHGIDRLRACIAAPCQDVFIDISKNATRRFCSERCANRHNVAQFRARQKR